jgi:hypothetical protein
MQWMRKVMIQLGGILGGLLLASSVSAQTPPAFTQGITKMQAAYEAGDDNAVMSTAQRISSAAMPRYDRSALGQFYVYLGLSLLRQKKIAFGEDAFRRAVEYLPSVRLPSDAPELAKALMQRAKRSIFARQKASHPFLSSTPSRRSSSPPSGSPQIGPIIALALGVLAIASLTTAVVAGTSAYVNVEEVRVVRETARNKGLAQIDVAPVLEGLQGQATTQSLLANVFYGVAGAAAISSVLVFFFMRPKAASAAQASLVLPPSPSPLSRRSLAQDRLLVVQ